MKKERITTVFTVTVETEGIVKDLGRYIEIRIHSLENNGGRVVLATAVEVDKPDAPTITGEQVNPHPLRAKDGMRRYAVLHPPTPEEIAQATALFQKTRSNITMPVEESSAQVQVALEGNGHAKDGQPMLVNMEKIKQIVHEEEAGKHPLRGSAGIAPQDGDL